MKHSRRLILAGCLPVLLGLCAPAEAQLPFPKFSVGGGLCTPMQDLKDSYGTGFQAVLGIEIPAIPMLSPFGEVSYSRFSADEAVLGAGADPFTSIAGLVGLKSTLGPGLVVKPYLLGAAGLADYEGAAHETKAMIALGGGVAFSKLAGEARFNKILVDNAGVSFISLTAKLRL